MLSQDRSLLLAAATETKLENLARESLEHKLQACHEALSRFEAKYGLTFVDFAQAWQEDKIPHKHSREVERDYMEWEARHVEKEELLAIHLSSRCSKR
jgi:hypothetical protein